MEDSVHPLEKKLWHAKIDVQIVPWESLSMKPVTLPVGSETYNPPDCVCECLPGNWLPDIKIVIFTSHSIVDLDWVWNPFGWC